MRKKHFPYLILVSVILVAIKIALNFDLWSNLDSRCIKLPFHSIELAHAFTSLVLGLALRGAPHFKSDISLLHLWALVGENGLHFYLFISSINYFFPFLKIKHYKLFILFFFMILTLSPALIRIFMFNIIMISQRKFKIKINNYLSLCCVFFISYLLGHFAHSPKGFMLSFCFWLSYLWGKRKTRTEQFLIIALIYSLIAIYFREDFSIFSIAFSTIILWFYIKCYRILLILFLYSFFFKWIGPIELGLKYFFKAIHFITQNLLFDSTSASIMAFFFIALSLILKRPYLILFLLIAKIDCANSPTIFLAG